MLVSRFRAVLVLLAVLLVASCTPGGHQPTGTGRTGSAASLLGDLRTLDPCTLIDPAALSGLGRAWQAETVSLDYCLLHLRLDNGSLVQVAVGQLVEHSPQADDGSPVVRRGELSLVQNAPLPGHCTRQVLFQDGLALQVNVDLLEGDPASGLCGAAESAAEAVIDAIDQHRVGHRQYSAESLAFRDPCQLLDLAVVRQVPGLEEAEPQAAPAGHQCLWGEMAAGSSRVQLVHTAGEPPRVMHGAAVEEQIAGRRTVLSIVGGDPRTPLCSAETAHIPFAGDGQVEVAMLVVAVPGETGVDACEYARGLAGHAWPKLP
ncbi:hypothetical protein [Saccharopolyspora rectivirgula]|uniref:DUF3558 domain-containing protein n=1 Tax=Saccharopolyspora rectivirgula TaxID=28042 RepID=A0A073B628_9PSEU|nr:hypothetical protein [Saccharopolyspora rectivirgula]KEI43084.1 hypothetical protein GU90_18330 [Saccharopolyspora rectivirgula]